MLSTKETKPANSNLSSIGAASSEILIPSTNVRNLKHLFFLGLDGSRLQASVSRERAPMP